jgi:hypothetical protein
MGEVADLARSFCIAVKEFVGDRKIDPGNSQAGFTKQDCPHPPQSAVRERAKVFTLNKFPASVRIIFTKK